jgi:hypothetical protein
MSSPKEAAASPIKLVSLPRRRLEFVYETFDGTTKGYFLAFHVCILFIGIRIGASR